MLEKMEMADDSYGVICELYGEIFEKYFQLDREYLGMEKENFFLDFIELILWEDYGCTDYHQNGFIKNITSQEIELVRPILSSQAKELNSLKFNYLEKKCKKLLVQFNKIHKKC